MRLKLSATFICVNHDSIAETLRAAGPLPLPSLPGNQDELLSFPTVLIGSGTQTSFRK
jgi:hypothetical protein